VWRSKIGWDDEISGSSIEKWLSWLKQLPEITNFRIPRCYLAHFSTSESTELHVFCDASEKAYGAVAYFRIPYHGKVEVALVMTRARVAPLKSLSIPRMELQAAVLGARLGNFIREGHSRKINKIYYWPDNQTVLCWLKSDSHRFKQFVGHRVGEIQELTNPTEWRWVPTAENVGDEVTRDTNICDWGHQSRWINGPDFLRLAESEWPQERTNSKKHTDKVEEAVEMKKNAYYLQLQFHQLLISRDTLHGTS